MRADPALTLEAGQLQRHAQLEEGLPAEHGTDEGAVLLQNPEKKCSFDPYLYITVNFVRLKKLGKIPSGF